MSDKTVQMYDPTTDKVVRVPAADVAGAQDEGLTIETESSAKSRAYERSAGLGEAAKATGEGLLSGATLGLSDVGLSLLGGDEYRENRELRDRNFGGFNTAGNIVGSLAPVLLSGGEGALAKAAEYTPTALVARGAGAAEHVVGHLLGEGSGGLVSSAVRGAAKWGAAGLVEGAAVGAGNALSEAAITDELGGVDQAAERAWAGAKNGAMMGLIGGAALGGLGSAAYGAAKNVARRFAQSGDELAEFANERAAKATGAPGSDLRKLGDEKLQTMGEDLRTYSTRDGTPVLNWYDNPESLAPKVKIARQEVGEELGALRQRVAETGEPVNALSYIQRVDDEVVRPLIEDASPTIRRQGRKVMAELDNLAGRIGRGEDITYGDLLAQNKSLQQVAYPKVPKGQGIRIAKEDWTSHLARAQQILEDEMGQHVESTLSKIDPELVGKYDDLKRLYQSFSNADALLTKSVGQKIGNRSASLTDYLTGLGVGGSVIASGHPLGALLGAAATVGNKLARERGNSLLATLYTRAASVDTRIEQGVSRFVRHAAESAVPAETLVSERLAKHSREELIEKAQEKAKEIGSITARDQAIKYQEGQEKAHEAFAAAGGEAVKAREVPRFEMRKVLRAQPHETENDAYDRIVAKAAVIATGKGMGAYVLDEQAPRVGNSMRAVQQRAAQHLIDHAPVPPKQNANPNLGAMSGDAHPDPVSLYEFSRRVKAIDDPVSIIDDLHHGTISMAAAEAVRDVYPQLFAHMQATMLDHLGRQDELLPYESRVRLGILFDIPADPTLRPENIALAQSFYQQQPPKVNPPSSSQGARSASIRHVETSSQQLEAGDYAAAS